ncbi:HAD family hydrolase [Marinicrinis lubricantis]|uniref:HAD family hydrolase n=1 Tax=Marinicrinis lubricantis TaxID=2086470 RepID=A0ABW1IUD4_9BACL
MSNKPHLMLDVGGVLLSNLSPLFWKELPLAEEAVSEPLVKQFKTDIRTPLWTGQMEEPHFWSWLMQHFPGTDPAVLRSLLFKHLTPLPGLYKLEEWSRRADIHLLSNHRAEWIVPILKKEGVTRFLNSVTISSEVRCCKPGREIYEMAAVHLNGDGRIVFVDDQEKNFPQAKRIGWKTILADPQGRWMEEIDRLL